MKKIRIWVVGLALIALPATAYFAPQYAPLIPVAQDVMKYIQGDNSTLAGRIWTE